jgi:hypothetical protein
MYDALCVTNWEGHGRKRNLSGNSEENHKYPEPRPQVSGLRNELWISGIRSRNTAYSIATFDSKFYVGKYGQEDRRTEGAA